MSPRIALVEAFVVTLPRDTPYLGPLGPGESVNARGYLVRSGNRTIYPTVDRSIVIKLTADDGTVGWGETYGLVAPDAVTAIINDVIAPVITGRDPRDPVVIQEDLYDLMRVRGFFGGFWVDAIAGIDIAVWDLFGKLVGQPVARLLGGQRHTRIPAYVSGLPRATLPERVELARDFARRGFDAFKYAAAVSFDGVVEEMQALRQGLGPKVRLMVDLHWSSARLRRSSSSTASPGSTRISSRPRVHPRISRARRRWRPACACRWRWARSGTRSTRRGRASSAAPWPTCSPRSPTAASASSSRSAAWPTPSIAR
jgi:Mandelate racemase / muconate lactonizing enzyme, N-terminal domain